MGRILNAKVAKGSKGGRNAESAEARRGRIRCGNEGGLSASEGDLGMRACVGLGGTEIAKPISVARWSTGSGARPADGSWHPGTGRSVSGAPSMERAKKFR